MWLANPVIAVLIATCVWWLSTGLVLVIVHWAIRKKLEPWQLLPLVTLVGIAGFLLMVEGSTRPTPMGSYMGFFGALLVWAWHETTFLTGMVTGRNKGVCPPDVKGYARFRAAWRAVCDHEIAILLTAVFLWFVLSGAPNTFGLATFGLLWGMRISAKLLIFLGARHAISALMPPGISHLQTYFNTGSTTPFFPLLLAIAVGLFTVLVAGAFAAHTDYSVVGHILLASFMALAIIEHLILVLPVSDTALWRWAVPKGNGKSNSEASSRHDFLPTGVGAKRRLDAR
ncbi:DUF3623 domain-containing protein [Roseibium denhamense]|uniref:Photosynthetic complex assembly protein 2 n=1 Tax=Roseibium denhamense TaxID=76305 RepID=A0ABY1PNI3_9HYPH|nr:putative photosynthetic complex assembly protein PuhE [Roseibium denhamense]MTI07076.1 DUF3623 domain-containing protein [Roseibium denhamense]SMP36361.1 putative photosynthetic complex assembly protein 2 [Roseibium denhamense]